jgi:hypothetical protein
MDSSPSHDSALRRLTDASGLIIAYPAGASDRLVVLRALAARIELRRVYTEHELNELIQQHVHPDAVDHVTVRRDLIDYQFIRRTDSGARYWRDETSEGIPPIVQLGPGTFGADHVEGERGADEEG